MAEHTHGEMNITEHDRTFAGFVRWMVRTFIIVFAVLAFLALTQT